MGNLLQHESLRKALLIWVVAFWVIMVLWPPMTQYYNFYVLLLSMAAVLLTGIFWWKLPQSVGVNSGCWLGLLLLCVTYSSYPGSQSYGPLMLLALCGLFVFMGEVSARLFPARESALPANVTIGAIVLVAAFSAIHGAAQYFWLYDSMLADFLRAQSGKSLDAVQEGIVHHLKLKRVASGYGDPNVLGTMLAVGVTASLELIRRFRTDKRLAAVGLVVALLSLGCLPLTGSRGGMLAAVIGTIAMLIGMVNPRREVPSDSLSPERRARRSNIALLLYWILLLLTVLSPAYRNWRDSLLREERRQLIESVSVPPMVLPDDTNTAAASGSDASALSRSTTIKERLNYLTIGMGMFRHSPVFGGGAGVVEADYGLYKPIDARETKTLHNWPVQWLAETGLVGTGIYLIFLASVFWLARPVRPGPWYTVTVCAAVILADGLWSLSLTNTAVMGLFGLLIGLMCGADAHVPTDEENARAGNRILPELGKCTNALLLTLGVCVVLYAAYSRRFFLFSDAVQLCRNGTAPTLYAAGLAIAVIVLAVKMILALCRKTGLRAALSCGGGLILLCACGGIYNYLAAAQYNLADLRDASQPGGDLKYADYLVFKAPRMEKEYNAKFRLAAADHYVAMGKKQRAEDELRNVYADTLDYTVAAAYAEFLLRDNRAAEALPKARRAVQLFPTKAEYRDLLSRAAEATGDTTGALEQERIAAYMAVLWKDRYTARVKQLELKATTPPAPAQDNASQKK